MDKHPNVIMYKYIIAHAPVTAGTIAAGLGWGLAEVDQAIAALIDVGLIAQADNDHPSDPLYVPLNASFYPLPALPNSH